MQIFFEVKKVMSVISCFDPLRFARPPNAGGQYRAIVLLCICRKLVGFHILSLF